TCGYDTMLPVTDEVDRQKIKVRQFSTSEGGVVPASYLVDGSGAGPAGCEGLPRRFASSHSGPGTPWGVCVRPASRRERPTVVLWPCTARRPCCSPPPRRTKGA